MKQRWLWLLGFAWIVWFAGAVHAQDPRGIENADGLHKRAIKAAKAGNLREAVLNWSGAESLDPQWKYAFNQVKALTQLGDWEEAWEVWQRAEAIGVPEGNEELAIDMLQELKDEFSKNHALLVFTVVPADAVVTRNGAQWKSPGQLWTREKSSYFSISAEGYKTETRSENHPIGVTTAVSVVLKKVEIGEAPSDVASDGMAKPSLAKPAAPRSKGGVGQKNSAIDTALEIKAVKNPPSVKEDVPQNVAGFSGDEGPGRKIGATAPETFEEEDEVAVENDPGTRADTIIVVRREADSDSVGPWIAVAVGGVLVAAGGVFTGLYLAEHTAWSDEVADINSGPENDSTKEAKALDAEGKYGESVEQYNLAQIVGYSVGAAVLVGGIVWLLLDEDEDVSPLSFGVGGTAGGAGVSMGLRF